MEWTSSTWCTCPQAAKVGTEAQRPGCLAESQDTPQLWDFCDETPIDEAADSVTLLWLL